MFIVSWHRETMVNTDQVVFIEVDSARIVARTTGGETLHIGRYSTPDRAREVFSEMLSRAFIPNIVLVNGHIDADKLAENFKDDTNKPWAVVATGDTANITPVAREVYYMPEE